MRYKMQVLPLTVVALAWLMPAASVIPASHSFAADFYVSLDGNDRFSGTQPRPTGSGGPSATIAQARDAVRAFKQ